MIDRDQWLKDRKKGIGGSDVGAILGVDPYKSALDVWNDKTDRSDDVQENAYMIAGRKLEKIVVEYWEEETGIKTKECGHLSHDKYNFILGTPDRIYSKDDRIGVLECKTTKYDIDIEDKYFMNFFCQLQWYLGLCRSEIGEIAIFNRATCQFNRFEFEFNDKFYDQILEQVINFWDNNIIKDVAPEPKNNSDITKLFKTHLSGSYIEASKEILDVVSRLKDVKTQIKTLENEENELSTQIKMILRDNEGLNYEGNPVITWKSSKETQRFDSDSFKKDHPYLWTKFQKTFPGSRRFLIK